MAQDGLTPLPTRFGGRQPSQSLEVDDAAAAYSPLESLGRRVGLARSNSLQVSRSNSTQGKQAASLVGSSEAIPAPPARPSPLIFNTFRHSRASSIGSDADYTASIYSTASGNITGYWAEPDLSAAVGAQLVLNDDDDAEQSDDDRTERGDVSDDEDDVGEIEVGHDRPSASSYEDDVEHTGERSYLSSDAFTTSSRLSRFLDASLVAKSPVEQPSSCWAAAGEQEQNVGRAATRHTQRSVTQPLLRPEPSFAPPRAGSVGALGQHNEGATRIQSVYGFAGGTWQAPQASSIRPLLAPSLPDAGPQVQLGNFSRSRPPLAVLSPHELAPTDRDLVPRPQRNASLRRPSEQNVPQPLTTSLSARSFIQPAPAAGYNPFPYQDSPPASTTTPSSYTPHPHATPYPAPLSLAGSASPNSSTSHIPSPSTVLLPSQNHTLHTSASFTRIQRPSKSLREESFASSVSGSTKGLPSRAPPPPPTDKPAFSGPTGTSTRLVRLHSKRTPPPPAATSRFASPTPASHSSPVGPSVPATPVVVHHYPEGLDLPPPGPRAAREGSSGELHPGSYSIYSLPTTPTEPSAVAAGTYTKVDVLSPQPSSELPPPAQTVAGSSSSEHMAGHRAPTQQQSWRPHPQQQQRAMTPQAHLERGLAFFGRRDKTHESLALAAMSFRSAATVDGGCSGGMLFYGLTLRSGWGVAKDEAQGFMWLRRAADSAPSAAGGAGGGQGSQQQAVVGSEMVVAILEVGTCFLHGWGCKKDPAAAVRYFLLSARMGDPDSMLALARCLAAGRGAARDRRAAAGWLRAAAERGAAVGEKERWAWKAKWGGPGEPPADVVVVLAGANKKGSGGGGGGGGKG